MDITKIQLLKNPLINSDGTITARPCTNVDLGEAYGVDRRTVIAWLKPFNLDIKKRCTYFYTQKQVELIFEKLGEPQFIDFNKLKTAA